MKSAISQALNGKVLCSLLLAPLCFLLGVALTSLYYSSSRPLSLLTSSGNFSNAPRKGLVTSSARSNSPASIECPRDWQGHLRVTSTPLDFQWLAVQEDSKDVKLVGPDGNGLDLKVLGTLTLLNNTVYKFDVTQSGSYELLVANERVSRFHLHPADCNCPGGFQEFLSQYQCPPRYGEEVRRSMARWLPHAITKEMMEYNGEHPGYHTHLAMLELAVFDNKLFCGVQNGQKCPPKPEDPLYFRTDKMIRLMHAVLRKVSLPDVIFFWSMEDNPMTQHYTMLPLYSSSSSNYIRVG